ncbi:hypothetical protein [Mucilaginibacter sp.]|uniref:hypothetical protein n=1 Tax=Mucilaginibacter sp. TaxID=1882438 RepID=UPI002639120D|nr:hypothetical protein [Mucilaginibacter sp.]MDB4925408.1 hypothetical protein [Mucilaginibacter sp.]
MNLSNCIKSIAVLTFILSLNACKKDNSAVTTSATQVTFALSATNPSNLLPASITTPGMTTNSVSTNATSASITWTSGTANIASFKLEAKKKNTAIEITSKNLTNIDLFAISPASISAAIDTGTYTEIELRVLLVKSTTAAIPLTLKGNFTTQGGVVVPIELDYNDDALIKVEAENITIDGKTDVATLAKLNLTKLISGMAAAQLDAAVRTNGAIIISSTVNATIYNKIKDNILLCGGWGGFSHREKSERK